MATAELRALYNPIKSQMFSTELAYLLARLEDRPIGLVVERALRAYANASPAFASYIRNPPQWIR
jgi:hypothetical protein